MDVNGVHRDAKDLTIEPAKFFCGCGEVEHFGGADKAEIKGVKKEKDPFFSVIR
jgi:hypothetical protein